MAKREFMKIAIQEAMIGLSSGDGGPFGAVIEKNGKVMGRGHNTVLRDNDPTKHAEINAIAGAAKRTGTYDLTGSTLYSTTEPCPMCFSAIHWARITRIVYGNQMTAVKELGFNELMISVFDMKAKSGSKVDIKSGFMLEECGAVLKKWEESENRQIY